MKQKLLLFMLGFKLAKMFLVDFYKVSKAEIKDKTLYPQSNYKSCLERATAILNKALERPLAYYATTIAHHRETCHGEGKVTDMVEVRENISAKEFKSATNRGFWLR